MESITVIFMLMTHAFVGLDTFTLSQIETTKEIYFNKIKHMQPYHFLVPLVYTIPLQNSHNLFEHSENLINLLGNYSESTNNHEALRGYMEHRKNVLLDFQTIQTNSRNKRSVVAAANTVRDFFGDMLVACCRVMTYRDGKKIVNNQDSLATSYNILKETMIEDHKNLFRVNKVIEMNQNLEKQTKIIKGKFNP